MLSWLLPLAWSLLSLITGVDEAEIVFAGDAMMHQTQIDRARRADGTYDFDEYFAAVTPYVSRADYAVVNLETPISPAPYAGYPCFNAPAAFVDALSGAGFDMFLTANNHMLDRSDRGLRATLDSLDTRRLDHIGTYRNPAERAARIPFIKNINGIRTGFLNYTYGTNGITPRTDATVDYIDRRVIADDVAATRAAGAEIVIVCIHWGTENRLLPDNEQRKLAEYIRDLDVDVIIGGHPHMIQPAEMTVRPDGRPQVLFYSLGNYVSNMLRVDNRGGIMASVTLRRDIDGVARVADASYRLTFTEVGSPDHNFRVVWPDESDDPVARQFSTSARSIFDRHNVGVAEDTTGIAR